MGQFSFEKIDKILSSDEIPVINMNKFNKLIKNNEKVKIFDFFGFLETNPFLSGKILRIINSGFYYVPHKIYSIRHAYIILGKEKLMEIVMTLFSYDYLDYFSDIKNSYKKKIFSLIYFFSYFMKNLSRIKGFDNVHYSFKLAIFRHIGTLFIPKIDKKFMNKLGSSYNEGLESLYKYEEKRYGVNHLEISKYIMKKYNFPLDFIDQAAKIESDDYFSKLISYSERLASYIIFNNFENINKFLNEFEENLLITDNILIDLIEETLDNFNKISDELKNNFKIEPNIKKFIKVLHKRDSFDSEEIISKLNSVEGKNYLIKNFINNLKIKKNINAASFFISLFNKYFYFDRVFYFEETDKKNTFKLIDYISDYRVKEIIKNSFKIEFKEDKKVYTPEDNILKGKLKRYFKEAEYYIFLISSSSRKIVLIVDNNITKKEITDRKIENILEFLDYSKTLYFDFYLKRNKNADELLKNVHKLGVSFSHMINNYLTIILTTANLLKRRTDNKDQVLLCDKIIQSIDKISEYLKKFKEINSLKDLSYLQGIDMFDLEGKDDNEDN